LKNKTKTEQMPIEHNYIIYCTRYFKNCNVGSLNCL